MSILFNRALFIFIILINFFSLNKASAIDYLMSNSTISSCGDNFYDSGGSVGNYGTNQNFTFVINPSNPGEYVTISFMSFSTQAGTDLLYIYDGGSTSSPLIGIYSGTSSPGEITARNSNGSLTFRFTSGPTVVGAGWQAVTSCSTTPGNLLGNYPMSHNAVDTICGGNFYDNGGVSGNYSTNQNSKMTFYPSVNGNYINVDFTVFNIRNGNHFLYIYDGPDTLAPLIGEYTGTVSPGSITARNTNGCLTFYFISNTTGPLNGWAATLSCSPSKGSLTGVYPMTNQAVDTVCGGTFYDSGGSGSAYGTNEDRTQTFYPAIPGNYISASFSAFNTQAQIDLLYIYDGTTASAPLIGVYSGNASPGTITARNTSGALTFVFSSNGSTQSTGWICDLSCSPIAGSLTGSYPMTNGATDTVCAGTFFDSGGPGGNYSSNENKTMTFYPATSGQFLGVNFTAFQTSSAADFLYIYDGTDTLSPLIGIYSGATNPFYIAARNITGALTFRFTSNSSANQAGWSAALSCSATPGSDAGAYPLTHGTMITACGGFFYDSNGPSNNYSANENKTMTFYPSVSGQYISMNFTSFSTQSNVDLLYIYDGPNNTFPLLGIYSGSNSPDTITARNPQGCLTFTFTSNSGSQAAGWAASFSCVSQPGTNSTSFLMTHNAVDTICGGRFYDSGGPTGSYFSNENKVMTFYPSNPGEYLGVTFSSFQTQSASDFLYVYDGPNTSSPLIGVYSGTTNPAYLAARNSAGCLTFRFISGNTTNQTGWSAVFNCSTTPGSDAGAYPMTDSSIITTCGGFFYDSNGPSSNYSANENKIMTFHPSVPGQFISMNFTSFLTQTNTDFLYIYDGPDTLSPLLGAYSGSTSPDTITARNSNGCLTFYFSSNNTTQSTGWNATISCVSTPGTNSSTFLMTNHSVDTICGGRFYDSGGPNANYFGNENKTMTFFPSDSGQYVGVNFNAFQTESLRDYLYIYDGPVAGINLIGAYSGNTLPGRIRARNSTGALTFVFVTNWSTNYSGWSAYFDCSGTPGSDFGTYLMTDNVADTICGGIFYDSGGITGNYESNESKIMTFFPSIPGNYMSVNFSSFTLENALDNLYIFDGPDTLSPLIGMYSGTTIPGYIAARNSTGSLTFQFISNNGGLYPGWGAVLSCTTIPGSDLGNYPLTDGAEISVCGGTFYDSGGSGNNYSSNENRKMTIYPATPGQFLSVAFSSFLTQANVDFLSIYDGPDTLSPLIGSYSGSVSPDTMTARNPLGCLTFQFISNANTNNQGWQATLSCDIQKGTTKGVYVMTNGAVDTICSGKFYDTGGNIGTYFSNESSTMTFFPEVPGTFLSANFSAFLTQASADILYIYDGADTTAPLMGEFSGTSGPCNIAATNSAGALTFRFVSNWNNQTTGWAANFSCVPTACDNSGCYPMTNNSVIRACGGTFMDAGGGSASYNPNENSTMTFYPSSGQNVQLNFMSFSTQNGVDLLYLYDGPDTSYPLIGSYSGTTGPGIIDATNPQGCITARFISNGSNQAAGWVALVNCTGTQSQTVWTGSHNSSWLAVNNWTNNCISPSCAVDVMIAPAPRIAEISGNVSARNVTIASGAELKLLPNSTLSICGDFENNGTITMDPTSILIFQNNTSVQYMRGKMTGSNAIGNLLIQKTAGFVQLEDSLDLKRNFTSNDSTSIFNSNGKHLRIGGNFMNAFGDLTYLNSALVGGIEFNGTNLQLYVPGGNLFFNNVYVNNTGPGILLSGADLQINVGGNLFLATGKVTTGGQEVKIFSASPTSILGGSSSSFIEGNLRRNLNGLPGSYNFPVGNSSKGYQNVNIEFTSTTSIPDILVTFNTHSSLINGPLSSDCNYLDYSQLPILNNGYWFIDPSANPNSGNYTMTLNNTSYTNHTSAGAWTVLRSTNSSGPWSIPGSCGINSTPAAPSRTSINGFGYFTTGQAPSITLPVEFKSFIVQKNKTGNQLNWTTASEINSDHFEVEHSVNGSEFNTIMVVNASGNSSIDLRYESFHEKPPVGRNYYRIKQVDFDRRSMYSEIRVVNTEINDEGYELSPNPTTGSFDLVIPNSEAEKTIINFFDPLGAMVKSVALNRSDAEELLHFDLASYPKGFYTIEVTVGIAAPVYLKLILN